ncbi:MAG: DNA replication/repair protein RecF [Armatimonadaceae bacterium]
MRVQSLELQDYRNYHSLRFFPHPGLNIFVGPNAQGKSNLLEAVYVLATTKSPRARRDGELIRFGAGITRIMAEVVRAASGDVTLEMALGASGGVGGERKLVRVNHNKQPRVTDLIGNLNAVLFSSVDLDIVRKEPEDRRRFLNYEIAQVSPRYVLALGAYRRALEQRNRLLKDMRYGSYTSAETLDAWTDQLVEHGAVLIERRKMYLDKLATHAAEVHRKLSGERETLVVEYQPAVPVQAESLAAKEIADDFTAELKRLRRDEIQRGTTLSGPQRDEVLFRVGADAASAVDVQRYGSQGQQRTVALSLRLAERNLIEEMVGEPPVVLLDDVLSDLDETRRAQIFALALSGGQTFLTTTDLTAIPPESIAEAAVWKIENGTVQQRGSEAAGT